MSSKTQQKNARTTNPSQQGLKHHTYTSWYLFAPARTTNPSQQGLKLTLQAFYRLWDKARTTNPSQQGLKLPMPHNPCTARRLELLIHHNKD